MMRLPPPRRSFRKLSTAMPSSPRNCPRAWNKRWRSGALPGRFRQSVAWRTGGGKTPHGRRPSLLGEVSGAAASLELLPGLTKTQLGDEWIARIKKSDFVETGLWCVARLGARELFYGPINQVLPPSTAARWVETLLKLPAAEDAIAALARLSGDSTPDLSPNVLDLVRRPFPLL